MRCVHAEVTHVKNENICATNTAPLEAEYAEAVTAAEAGHYELDRAVYLALREMSSASHEELVAAAALTGWRKLNLYALLRKVATHEEAMEVLETSTKLKGDLFVHGYWSARNVPDVSHFDIMTAHAEGIMPFHYGQSRKAGTGCATIIRADAAENDHAN